jgi:hypothetical protein
MITEAELSLELNVNGQSIEMNEFVQRITSNILLGFLRSLRLDEEPRTAVLTLKVK